MTVEILGGIELVIAGIIIIIVLDNILAHRKTHPL